MSNHLMYAHQISWGHSELAHVCSSTLAMLGRSLESVLIPNYNFLKNVLLSEENVIKLFRKRTRIFSYDLQEIVSPKLVVFGALGMREAFSKLILSCHPPVLLQRQDKFDDNVKKVIEMGFDPQKCEFIHALQVSTSISQSTLEDKLDVFRK